MQTRESADLPFLPGAPRGAGVSRRRISTTGGRTYPPHSPAAWARLP